MLIYLFAISINEIFAYIIMLHYFRGLFGMLAESAVPSEAYRSLEDLPERPGWWETAQTWEKAMVIIASIVGFCCLCGCLGALFKKFRSAPEA